MKARSFHYVGVATLVIALGLLPLPAHAGLDLTWRACNLVPGRTADETFTCSDSNARYTLFGCFQLPTDYDYAEFMDVTIDFETPNPTLSPFWHLEIGGCNEGQLQASIATGCPANALWPWSTMWRVGALDYQPGLGGANRARLSFTIEDRGPFYFRMLKAGVNYFAFTLTFITARATESGGPCQGCADPIVVIWSEAKIRSTWGYVPATLASPGLVSQCVTVNGSSPACVPSPTPVRNSTWGSIKTLYR